MQYILIADDNADITDVLEAYVRKEGYEPLIAADGEEAYTLEDAVRLAEKYAAEGMKSRQACKKAAEETGMRSNEIYSALMQE